MYIALIGVKYRVLAPWPEESSGTVMTPEAAHTRSAVLQLPGL